MKSNISNKGFGRLAAITPDCEKCRHNAHTPGDCPLCFCGEDDLKHGNLFFGSFTDISADRAELPMKKAA